MPYGKGYNENISQPVTFWHNASNYFSLSFLLLINQIVFFGMSLSFCQFNTYVQNPFRIVQTLPTRSALYVTIEEKSSRSEIKFFYWRSRFSSKKIVKCNPFAMTHIHSAHPLS